MHCLRQIRTFTTSAIVDLQAGATAAKHGYEPC